MFTRLISAQLVFALVALGLSACDGDANVGTILDGGLEPTPGSYDECGNGLDDDRDSRIDEDCFCAADESQDCFPSGALGACGPGSMVCDAGVGVEWGRWGSCEAAPRPMDEACDGTIDDDCDGTVDEGCACEGDMMRPCGPEGVGACRSGTQQCADGSWSTCEGAEFPSAEVCGNGVDDDCDGTIDDPSLCECVPEPERCADGVDNDCDGVVDEPDGCFVCSPAPELCGDGEDQDCDGIVDEGSAEICGDGIDQDCDGMDDLCSTMDGGVLTDPGPMCSACTEPGYLWDLILSGSASITGMAIDGAGDVLVAGTFSATTIDLGGGPRTTAGKAGFLAKVGRDGTYRWDRIFESLGSGFTRVHVGADAWGNVFVGGSFEGTLDLGDGPRTSSGGESDAWLASYTVDGDLRWDRVFGGEGHDSVSAIAVEPMGDLYIGGGLTGTTDVGGGPRTSGAGINATAFLASYDRDGSWRWDRVLDTPSHGTSFSGLALTSDGLQVVGRATFDVDLGGGERDIPTGGATILAEYALVDGGHRWDRRYPGPANLRAFARGLDGNLYVAGTFGGSRATDFGGGARTSTSMGVDLFVASYDDEGRYRWDRTFGNDLPESVDGLAVDPFTNLFVVGSFHGTVDFGGGGQTAPGLTADAFLTSYGSDRSHRYDRTWGSPGNVSDQGSAVAIDPRTGTVYVAGSFADSVDFGGGPREGRAGFLVALGCTCMEVP